MKCPCRVGKHCAVQALPDICSCRSSTHSCTKTVHWSHEMLCSIFGPGYARPHILLQFSGIVLCTSQFNLLPMTHDEFCSFFGPGYARSDILLQFGEIVFCTSQFDARLNAFSTTEKTQSTLMQSIRFNILFRAVFELFNMFVSSCL